MINKWIFDVSNATFESYCLNKSILSWFWINSFKMHASYWMSCCILLQTHLNSTWLLITISFNWNYVVSFAFRFKKDVWKCLNNSREILITFFLSTMNWILRKFERKLIRCSCMLRWSFAAKATFLNAPIVILQARNF